MDYKALKSIVLITRNHDLDPALFLDAFVEAWRDDVARYRDLKISCRERNQDFAFFLITKGGKFISQFSISLESLKNLSVFKESIQYVSISSSRRLKIDQTPRNPDQKIGDLRVGMKRINIRGKITEIPTVKRVFTRYGNQSYVSNVKIADDTGAIRLSLWNKQIERVQVEDEVEIKNGYVSSFAGEPQLRIGRSGSMTVTS